MIRDASFTLRNGCKINHKLWKDQGKEAEGIFSFYFYPNSTGYELLLLYSIPMWTQDPMKKGSSLCVAVNLINDARQPVALISIALLKVPVAFSLANQMKDTWAHIITDGRERNHN